ILLLDDLGSDAFVGEDLQQDGVGHATIHERDLLDARLDGGHGAIHLRNHPFVDDPALLQHVHLADLQAGDDTVRLVRVLQQARHVAHEDQAPGFQRNRRLRGGYVGVAVVDFAILAERGRADNRRDAFLNALEQRGNVHAGDLAYVAEVQRLAVRPLQASLAAPEDLRAGEPFGDTTQRGDGRNHLGVDFAREHVVGNLHGGFVGDALALDEVGLETGLLHRPGDGLAAAVNDHWVNFYRFQEDDVARDPVAGLRVRRVHEAAAVFDDKGGAAEALDVRQGFQQCGSFGNEVLHVKRKGLMRPLASEFPRQPQFVGQFLHRFSRKKSW